MAKSKNEYVAEAMDYIAQKMAHIDLSDFKPERDPLKISEIFRNALNERNCYWIIDQNINRQDRISLHMRSDAQGEDIVFVNFHFDPVVIRIFTGYLNTPIMNPTEPVGVIEYREAWFDIEKLSPIKAILLQAIIKANSWSEVPFPA